MVRWPGKRAKDNRAKRRQRKRSLRKSPPAGGDWGKISGALVAIASPWVENLGPNPPHQEVTAAHIACAQIWNITWLPEAEQKPKLDEMVDVISSGSPDVPISEVRELVYGTRRRILEQHADDPRKIVAVDVTDLGNGKFHVQAAGLHEHT
jgi:hypothetical protein